MYKVPIAGQYRITQKFGETLLDYSRFGIPGHNGIDLAANRATPIIAPYDGFIVNVRDNIPENLSKDQMVRAENSTGNYVEQLCDIGENSIAFRFLHMLPQIPVQVGQFVVQGAILGYVGTTGNSTGFHTHWDGRLMKPLAEGEQAKFRYNYLGKWYDCINYENGYKGMYDFYDEVDWVGNEFKTPVELRYGQAYSHARELAWSVRYSEQSVMNEALKRGYGGEWKMMRNAFIYGYWNKDFVMDIANYPIWAFNTKPAYDLYLKTKDPRHLQKPLISMF